MSEATRAELTPVKILGTYAVLPAPTRPAKGAARAPEAARGGAAVRRLQNTPQMPAQMAPGEHSSRYARVLAAAAFGALGERGERVRLGALAHPTRLSVCSLYAGADRDVELGRRWQGTDAQQTLAPQLACHHAARVHGAASEVAARAALQGRYASSFGGPATLLSGILKDAARLRRGWGERVLSVSADVLGPSPQRQADTPGDTWPEARSPTLAEAGAAVWLTALDDPAPGYRVDISGVLAGSARALLSQTRDIRGCWPAPAQIVSVAPNPRARRACEALCDRLAPHVEILHLAWRWGNCGATLGTLGILTALESSGATWVIAADAACSVGVCVCPVPS